MTSGYAIITSNGMILNKNIGTTIVDVSLAAFSFALRSLVCFNDEAFFATIS